MYRRHTAQDLLFAPRFSEPDTVIDYDTFETIYYSDPNSRLVISADQSESVNLSGNAVAELSEGVTISQAGYV